MLFRLLQGVFGAALVPLSQATMLDLYPVEQRGSAMAMWGMGVVVGPILGPTLGGYLTDCLQLALGVLHQRAARDRRHRRPVAVSSGRPTATSRARSTGLGFAVLSLGLGALQLMLDRGEQKDWFGSTEIVVEAVLCGLGFYLFAVQTFTAERPLIPPRMLRDLNFVGRAADDLRRRHAARGHAALLAPYLQTLAGYSVVGSGPADRAARGRNHGRHHARRPPDQPRRPAPDDVRRHPDDRGIAMADDGMDPGRGRLVALGHLDRPGLRPGLLFTPLGVIAFSTLPAELRTEGTALFSLLRNVGSAIGISVTSVLLTRKTQIMHAQIAEGVTPFNRSAADRRRLSALEHGDPAGVAALNAEVTRQASIVAYVDDFKLLFLVCLALAPLLLLMRRPETHVQNGGLRAAIH